MTAHPLIELANDASVKAAGSFREAAEALTGARLAEMYREEKQAAAAEVRADVAHFVGHDGGFEGDIAIDEKELAIAVYNQCELDQVTLKLLDGVPPRDADDVDDEGTPPTEVTLLDYAVPVTALSHRKIKARMRVVSADALTAARDEMTEAVEFANSLARAKTVADALELQRGYWTKLFETRVERARAATEASVEATREMFDPINRSFAAAFSMTPSFDKFFPFGSK